MTFVLDPGSYLELDCMFAYDEYNVFKNPIVWKKRQMNETVSVNLNKNIYPPFLDTKRFEISLSIATTASTTTQAISTSNVTASLAVGQPTTAARRTVVHEQLRLSSR